MYEHLAMVIYNYLKLFKSSSEIRTYIMKYHLDDICAYGDYSINELVQNGRIEYRNGYYIEI